MTLFEPVIALAEQGFAVSPRLHKQTHGKRKKFTDAKTRAYFLDPDGHQLEAFMQRTPAEADQHEAFRTVGVKATPIDLDSITD